MHESCAEAVLETWITLIGGQKYVCGVDKIVKDRWTLVSGMTRIGMVTHGCVRNVAFARRVRPSYTEPRFNAPRAGVPRRSTLAALDHQDVEYTIGEAEESKEPSAGVPLKMPAVTALCPQHNPVCFSAINHPPF